MIKEIGQKIRNLRTAADLTQDELANRSGLTDGFISQIERGLTSISIDSLRMILEALNISLSDFFHEEQPKPIVFSQKDQVKISEGGTANLKLLVPGGTNRRLEPALLELPPESGTSLREPFDGDLYGFVLKGRINLKFGSEEFRVSVGENFYFTAKSEYQISNPFKRPATILWITSPPYF